MLVYFNNGQKYHEAVGFDDCCLAFKAALTIYATFTHFFSFFF